MNYRHPRHRIHEITQTPKVISEGHVLEVENKGEHSAKWDASLDLVDGPFCDLRYLGKAGRKTEVETYDASLLLEQIRVRGVGYCAVERSNFRAKLRVPAGWHQNICDANVATDDPNWNRHELLTPFDPTDLTDFIRQAAALWSIDLGWETDLL